MGANSSLEQLVIEKKILFEIFTNTFWHEEYGWHDVQQISPLISSYFKDSELLKALLNFSNSLQESSCLWEQNFFILLTAISDRGIKVL